MRHAIMNIIGISKYESFAVSYVLLYLNSEEKNAFKVFAYFIRFERCSLYIHCYRN